MEIPPEGILFEEFMENMHKASSPVPGLGNAPKPGDAPEKTPEEIAAEVGLPFKMPERIVNPHLAQELTLWANTKGKWFDLYFAIFSARFGEGKDITDITVLSEIAESVGLPKEEAREVLETGAFKKAVDEDWAESRTHEIATIPAYILGDAKIVNGATPEAIAKLLDDNGVAKKS